MPTSRFSLSLLALLAVFAGARAVQADSSDTAVLIMAHGGSSQWDNAVKRAVKGAKLPCPYKIFFGMGDTAVERNKLQDYVTALEDKGAHTIIVVPLLISSFSEVARQWKYLLGLDVQPGFISNPLFPIDKHASIRLAEPLNDSAVVVEILLDRIHEISADPAKESVIIVAHGPNDDTDNRRWSQILMSLSERIQKRGGFASVEGCTLHDDAISAIRRQAVERIRSRIEAIGSEGRRALVVSFLLAPGGIENKIGLELRGLNYAFNTKTLLPDSRISEWVRSHVP